MPKSKEDKNEIYALHLDGKLIADRKELWKKYSKKYGQNELYGWRTPKCFYLTAGRARCGRNHLPAQIQKRVTIVKYVPAGDNNEKV